MFTTGSKFYFGLSGLAFAAAVVFGISTGGHLWGTLSFGYKEAVGDHLGYAVLMMLSAASFLLGSVVVTFRDADADVVSAAAGTDAVPEVLPPRSASFWPVVAAFAGGLMVLGLATSPGLFVLGAIVAVVAAVEWTITAWADRATGDPEVNQLVRERLMKPLEVPLFAATGIAVVVLAFSRILLAVSKNGSVVVGLVASVLMVAAAFAVAYRPQIGRTLATGVLAVFAVGILVAGVVGAALGERDFEHHGEEEGEHSSEGEGEGAGGADGGEDAEASGDAEADSSAESETGESEEGLAPAGAAGEVPR